METGANDPADFGFFTTFRPGISGVRFLGMDCMKKRKETKPIRIRFISAWRMQLPVVTLNGKWSNPISSGTERANDTRMNVEKSRNGWQRWKRAEVKRKEVAYAENRL